MWEEGDGIGGDGEGEGEDSGCAPIGGTLPFCDWLWWPRRREVWKHMRLHQNRTGSRMIKCPRSPSFFQFSPVISACRLLLVWRNESRVRGCGLHHSGWMNGDSRSLRAKCLYSKKLRPTQGIHSVCTCSCLYCKVKKKCLFVCVSEVVEQQTLQVCWSVTHSKRRNTMSWWVTQTRESLTTNDTSYHIITMIIASKEVVAFMCEMRMIILRGGW